MNFKFNALVAAAAVLASAGAQAAITKPNEGVGSSSVIFVALDKNGTAADMSLAINTGYTMADFLAASGTQGVAADTVFAAGSLSAAGSGFSLDLATLGGTAYTTFMAKAATAGHSYTWGVIAGDRVSDGSGVASAGDVIANYNYLQTGNPTAAQFSGSTSLKMSSATNNLQNFMAALTGDATTSTAGASYLNTTLKANFGNQSTFSYLLAPGATSAFTWFNQGDSTAIYSLGSTYGVGALAAATEAATFTFDGTTLTYAVPSVPEPESYAMLLAGLCGLAFVARRRAAR